MYMKCHYTCSWSLSVLLSCQAESAGSCEVTWQTKVHCEPPQSTCAHHAGQDLTCHSSRNRGCHERTRRIPTRCDDILIGVGTGAAWNGARKRHTLLAGVHLRNVLQRKLETRSLHVAHRVMRSSKTAASRRLNQTATRAAMRHTWARVIHATPQQWRRVL